MKIPIYINHLQSYTPPPIRMEIPRTDKSKWLDIAILSNLLTVENSEPKLSPKITSGSQVNFGLQIYCHFIHTFSENLSFIFLFYLF